MALQPGGRRLCHPRRPAGVRNDLRPGGESGRHPHRDRRRYIVDDQFIERTARGHIQRSVIEQHHLEQQHHDQLESDLPDAAVDVIPCTDRAFVHLDDLHDRAHLTDRPDFEQHPTPRHDGSATELRHQPGAAVDITDPRTIDI